MQRGIAWEVDTLFAKSEATATDIGFNGSELDFELLGGTTSTGGLLRPEITSNPYLLKRVSRQ